jgi:hypothetical protein
VEVKHECWLVLPSEYCGCFPQLCFLSSNEPSSCLPNLPEFVASSHEYYYPLDL